MSNIDVRLVDYDEIDSIVGINVSAGLTHGPGPTRARAVFQGMHYPVAFPQAAK